MLAPALRVKEPTFRAGIVNYVTTTCRRCGIPCADVDDIKQDALIHILAKVDTFCPEKSEFEQWARGLAWNVIREYLRKAKLYLALFTEYHANVHDYAAQEPSPELCARRNQARCAIEIAVQNISVQQTQVLLLHAVDEMPHGEIGRELCISEAMAQKDYQRARNHLAQCFSGKAFSVMPLSLTSCDEPASFNESHSQRFEKSHHRWQGATVILAVLLAILRISLTTTHETTTGDAQVLAPVQNESMYRSDERAEVQDEPAVHQDAPNVKPEPASSRSVRFVPTHTTVADKPTYVQDLEPLPPYKPKPHASDRRLRGR